MLKKEKEKSRGIVQDFMAPVGDSLHGLDLS
jgi:hypothetical protein